MDSSTTHDPAFITLSYDPDHPDVVSLSGASVYGSMYSISLPALEGLIAEARRLQSAGVRPSESSPDRTDS